MTLSQYPVSVVGLAWALGALRWKEGIAGVTHAGIKELTGVETDDGIRALVRRAQSLEMVEVRYQRGRPVVSLSNKALKALETVLSGG